MDVLVTGGDTLLGRTIAEGFRDDGHRVVLSGARRDDLEVAAKELDVDAVVCDNTDADSIGEVIRLFPSHLDTIINVPAPVWESGDPRTFSLTDHASAWRTELDTTMISAVLTVAALGDHLRSGGSVISVVADNPAEGSAAAAVKAALSNWTAGRAVQLGTRGITVNVVAAGRGSSSGYDGLSSTTAPLETEISRLASFLATPGARHITGQTLHVSSGKLVNFG